jgi:hypothetical protein
MNSDGELDFGAVTMSALADIRAHLTTGNHPTKVGTGLTLGGAVLETGRLC